MGTPPDFSIDALYSALDAERLARGLTWTQLTRDVNAQYRGVHIHPISVSTITGMRTRRAIEGDGVLQMLLWLNRTPESFVSEHDRPTFGDEALPHVDPSRILRFDTRALYAALDAERSTRNHTWAQIATEIGGLSASSLSRATPTADEPDFRKSYESLDGCGDQSRRSLALSTADGRSDLRRQ